MEVVQVESVKVPNSLIVSGLSNSELDKELFDFLRISGRRRTDGFMEALHMQLPQG